MDQLNNTDREASKSGKSKIKNMFKSDKTGEKTGRADDRAGSKAGDKETSRAKNNRLREDKAEGASAGGAGRRNPGRIKVSSSKVSGKPGNGRSRKGTQSRGGGKTGKGRGKTGSMKAAKNKPRKKANPETISKIIRYIKDVIIGIILGTGEFMAITSEFGLSWNHREWSQGSFMGGLVKSWNDAAHTLAAADGVFLPQLSGEGDSNGFFLTICLLFLILISVLIVLGRNKWIVIIYPLVLIVPTVIWGLQASVISICIMCLGMLLHFINTDTVNLKFAYRGLIYALVIVIAAFAVISIPAVSKLADGTASVNDIREDIAENVTTRYYGEKALNNGDLTIKNRSTGTGTALKVSMSSPQSMYLRGFVGDVLTNTGWTPLSPATYYDQTDFVYWMTYNGFNGLGQLGQSAELAKQGGSKYLNPDYYTELNTVSVENVGTSTQYAYIPYEITIDGVADTKNWGDNYLTGGKYNKVESYSFDTYPNATGNWTEYASALFANKYTPADQATYLENESYYNNYVYSKYTYISDEDREILSYAMPDTGDQTLGHVEYNEAINSVKQLISYNFTYSEELSGYSSKNSALRNIFDNLEGYDAQLATAAVMMFRYYGIPARYVEGYLISEEDVAYGQTSVDVPRENAHAWAEIYVDGVGFVPVEVCSEFAGEMAEADYSVGIKTKTHIQNADQSTINDEDPNVITQDTDSGSGRKMPNRAVIIVGIIAALALLIALILLIRRLIKKIKALIARNRLFKTGKPKEAVQAIYKHMEQLGLNPDEDTRLLGNEATYSLHAITENDRKSMLSKLDRLKMQNKVDKRKAKAKARADKKKNAEKAKKEKQKQKRLEQQKKNSAKAKAAVKSNKSKSNKSKKTVTPDNTGASAPDNTRASKPANKETSKQDNRGTSVLMETPEAKVTEEIKTPKVTK